MMYLASDHAGFALKEVIAHYLHKSRIVYEDSGTNNSKPTHYPTYAARVAKLVQTSPRHRGILICGSGVGMTIMANRFTGIRAALCESVETARRARSEDDANILVLGQRIVPHNKALRIVKAWLTTPFSGKARYRKRLQMLDQLHRIGSREQKQR